MIKRLVFLSLFLSGSVFGGSPPDAKSIGESISNDLKNFYFKDKDTMTEKLFSPVSDSTKDFELITGEKVPFGMDCMETKPFAQIFYTPSTSGKDINLYIKMDYDFDGIYEKTTSISGVSGICTTGVIVCKPGSSSSCQFYSMNVDSSGYVIFDPPVPYTSTVASCYFINASGGNMSVSVPEGVSKILTDLSGIVGALVSKSKDFVAAIGEKDFLNFKVTLVGKKPVSCASISVDNLSVAKSYYSLDGEDDSSLVSDADAVRTGIKKIPIDGLPATSSEDVYSFVSSSPSILSNPPPVLVTCMLNRVPKIYTKDRNLLCAGNILNIGGKEWCVVKKKTNCPPKDFSCRGTSNYVDSGPVEVSGTWYNILIRPYQESMILFEQYKTKGDRGGYVKLSYSISGDYSSSISYNQNYSDASMMPTQFFYTPVPLDKTERRVSASYYFKYYGKGKYNRYPGKYYYVMFLVSRSYKQDIIAPKFYENCPSDCNLQEEWVCDKDGTNCVKTVDNGAPLAVTISPFCYTKTTFLDTYTVCADGSQIIAVSSSGKSKVLHTGKDAWFIIKRKYLCPRTKTSDPKMPEKEDFSNLFKSRESIYSDPDKTAIGNYDPSTGSFKYLDPSGKWATGSVSTFSHTCKKVCRVKVNASKKPEDYTAEGYQASMNYDLSSSEPVKSKEKMDYIVLKDCIKDTCPLETGEQLLDDCFCLGSDKNIDVQSMTSLQSLYEATKDMICSDSPP